MFLRTKQTFATYINVYYRMLYYHLLESWLVYNHNQHTVADMRCVVPIESWKLSELRSWHDAKSCRVIYQTLWKFVVAGLIDLVTRRI